MRGELSGHGIRNEGEPRKGTRGTKAGWVQASLRDAGVKFPWYIFPSKAVKVTGSYTEVE